jgi:phage baseplate assembly protein W
MHSLRIRNGDLTLTGSKLSLVDKQEKLAQDLSHWIATHYGIDPFHPTFGSTIQDLIGTPNYYTKTAIENEIRRICKSYQNYQQQKLEIYPNRYSLEEVLAAVNNIGIAFKTTSISITLIVLTAANSEVEVSQTIGA